MPENKTALVQLRIKPSVKAAMKAAAERADKTVSQWLLDLAIAEMKKRK